MGGNQGLPPPPERKGLNRFSSIYGVAAASALLRPTAQYGKWKEVCQKNGALANDLAQLVVERHDLLGKAKKGQGINLSHFDGLTRKLAQNKIHLFSSEQLGGLVPPAHPPKATPAFELPEITIPNALAQIPSVSTVHTTKKTIPNGFSKDEEVIMDMRYGNPVLSQALLGYGKDQRFFLPWRN